jgi:ATP-dependent RNA helicase DDX49/DBP8
MLLIRKKKTKRRREDDDTNATLTTASKKHRKIDDKESDKLVQTDLASLKRRCATARFESFEISKWLVDSCNSMGMTRPTPVQIECIPQILKGRNCVACAQTGSGKTATFAIPILQHLSRDPYGVFAVVITPTRELAMQIADQFRALGAPMKIRVAVTIGGLSALSQSLEINRRPHVIVATPGRLAAHVESVSPPHLKATKYLVLDEADRLLDGGFRDDLRTIVDALPKKRQTLLFSATMGGNVKRTAIGQSESVPNPFVFDISEAQSKVAVPETLSQNYIFVPAKVKMLYLFYTLLESFLEDDDEEGEDEDRHGGEDDENTRVPRVRSAIVFCATCDMCQLLNEVALELEIPSVCLHSRLTQNRRIAALAKFKSASVPLLFATDVASRGLDIPQVELVINFDVPQDKKDYVHRIGRAARAGREGRSLTVVSQHDVELVQSIEEYTGTKMTDFEVISKRESDVLSMLNKVSTATRVARLRMSQDNWQKSFNRKRH